jgi:hypothetical protein
MTAMSAEIPTGEAAQAFVAQTRQYPEFESLFAMLEAAGIPMGIEGRLRIWVVLSRLIGLGVQLDDTAMLCAHLTPVLAGSPHEQEDVRRLINDWIKSDSAGLADASNRAQIGIHDVVPDQVKQLERADSKSVVTAAGLGAVALIAFVGIVANRLWSGASETAAHAAGSVVTYSQPMLSIDVGLSPFWKPIIEDGLSRLAFAAAVLFVGLSFAAWRRDPKGRLVRRSGEVDLVNVFRVVAAAPRWFRTIDARMAFDRLKRVRWLDTYSIDVEQTVARTTRSGGRPVIVYKRQRELPNYVLLVDRSARDDHAGLFARALEGALSGARIVYSRYDFFGTPERLNPVRGGAQSDIVDAEYLPFSVVASRHAGERLILVGNGTQFFEVPGIRFDRSGHRTVVRPGTPLSGLLHLREFSSTSLVTSAPVSAWGENERRLRDLGFAIFPAEVKGIEELATQIMSGPDTAASSTAPLVSSAADQILNRLDRSSLRFMSEIPPQRDEIRRLIADLKAWAGSREIYTLLAAIAAFPKIDPGFTFVLGRLVLASSDGLVDSALFGRLIRLPWIRDGYMPDWVRIAVINGLNQEERDTIRRIQTSMMARVENAQEEDNAPTLDLLVATFEVARELTPGKLTEVVSRIQRNTGSLTADERIFFSVLHDEKLDPVIDVIQPEAPEIVAYRMDAPERRRVARLRGMVIGIAALAALAQPWLWTLLTKNFGVTDAALRLAAEFAASQSWAFPRAWTQEFTYLALLLVMLSALAQWLFNVMRREPRVLLPAWEVLRSLSKHIWYDPRISASSGCFVAFFLALGGSAVPGAGAIGLASGQTAMVAALVLLAWVWIVTPDRWWLKTSAESMLGRQLRRDSLTVSLGALAVVSVWAIPWFLGVLPILVAKVDNSIASLFFAAMLGAVAWAASNALMRRWLLGESYTTSLNRVWLDVAFACLVSFLLAVLVRSGVLQVPFVRADDEAVIGISVVSYYIGARGNLGIRSSSLVWRPALNAILAGTLVVTTLGIASNSDIRWISGILGPDLLLLAFKSGFFLCGVLVCGGLTVFALRSLGPSRSRYVSPWYLMVGLLASFSLFSGYTFLLMTVPPFWQVLKSVGRVLASLPRRGSTEAFEGALWGFVLPSVIMFWPVFSFLGLAVEPNQRESMPWWRRLAESPWWGTLAMWLAAIGWHFGPWAFSLWPLTLLIAAVLAWRHGARAIPAIAFGTFPLILRLGDGDNIFWTPGGVWPALATLFWARFVADESFRQGLLRRESLSWTEAGFIVLLLAFHWDVSLPLGASIATAIHVDPNWMLTTVAFIIGASRMPASRFAVALVSVWIVLEFPFVLVGHSGRPAISIGLGAGEVATTLLVLYAARAWRRYAASGVGFHVKDPLTGLIDRRLVRMQTTGILLASAAALEVQTLACGYVPAIQLGRAGRGGYLIDSSLVPTTSGALALATVAGLIAGNLWADRVNAFDLILNVESRTYRVFRYLYSFVPAVLTSRMVSVLFVSLYFLVLAVSVGPTVLDTIGIGTRRQETIPFDLKTIGFAVSCIVFATFGAVMRIVAERKETETSWRETARRLWSSIPAGEPRGSIQASGRSATASQRDLDVDTKSAA